MAIASDDAEVAYLCGLPRTALAIGTPRFALETLCALQIGEERDDESVAQAILSDRALASKIVIALARIDPVRALVHAEDVDSEIADQIALSAGLKSRFENEGGGVRQTIDSVLLRANVALDAGDLEAHEAIVSSCFSAQGFGSVRRRVRDRPLCLGNIEAHSESVRPTDDRLVSVIMPAWNASSTIEFAIRSVLAQSWRNIEIVVVDDASDDDTLEIAHAIAQKDARVRVVVGSSRRGPYHARNTGLSAARGDFIAFQDADDWSHPDRIAAQMMAMDEGGFLATTTRWVRMRHDGMIVNAHIWPLARWNPSSLVVAREVMDTIGPFDCVAHGADTEYWSRIQIAFGSARVKNLRNLLSIGSFRANSLSGSKATGIRPGTHSANTREDYRRSWLYWHADCVKVGVVARLDPLDKRPFVVPSEIEAST